MIRPPGKPTPDQQRRVDRIAAAFYAADELEERAWKELYGAQQDGILVDWVMPLIEREGRSRATVFRRLRRMDDEGKP